MIDKKKIVQADDTVSDGSIREENTSIGEKGGVSEGTVIIEEDITFVPDITSIEELEDEEFITEEEDE